MDEPFVDQLIVNVKQSNGNEHKVEHQLAWMKDINPVPFIGQRQDRTEYVKSFTIVSCCTLCRLTTMRKLAAARHVFDINDQACTWTCRWHKKHECQFGLYL